MAASVTDTLLPSNATQQERALEGATARISDVPVLVRESKDPNACPAVLLPWLAHQYSVDAWQTDWAEAQKRQVIRDSVYVHQHKGTIGAVKRSLASLGFGVQVQEWFNQSPMGAPYTFRLLLTVDQVGFSQADLASLQAVVNAAKNLRSHLSEVVPSVRSSAGPIVAAATNIGTEITVSGFVGNLIADGTVIADGTYKANGIKIPLLLLNGSFILDGQQRLNGINLNG